MQQIKLNTMKYIYVLALLLLFVGQTKAQSIIAVEKQIDYIRAGKGGMADGTYLKDTNHLMDPLIGTWKIIIDNKTFNFYVTKIIENSYGILIDKLEVRHYIVDNNSGVIIEDSRNNSKLYISADYFDQDYSTYKLSYYGENSRCGQKGHIRLKSLSPTTMNFYYSRYPFGLKRKEECPGGEYLKALFPENVDLILNKQ